MHIFQKTLSARTANGSCRMELHDRKELWFPYLVCKNNEFFEPEWPKTDTNLGLGFVNRLFFMFDHGMCMSDISV